MKILNTYISKLNIVLLVANITIIGAFFISNSKSKEDYKGLNYQTNTNEFIKKELGFSDEQYEKYLELNDKIMNGYKRNEEITCQNHYQFLLELAKDEPSLYKLDSISRASARIYAGHKTYTARHFLNIKSLCTPEQDKKLQQLIKEMLHIGACKSCVDSACVHKTDNVEIK